MSSVRWAVLGCVLGVGLSANAEVVSLPAVADTTIFAFSPNNNLGSEKELILGSVAKNAPNNRARMLVRFDLSGIPTRAVITNVTLQVRVLRENFGARPEQIDLLRMQVDWAEGNRSGKQGAAAAAGQPTWNARAHQQANWGVPGGQAGIDFADAVSSSQALDGAGNYTFPSSAALVADVQDWLLHPESNHGWMLKSENEAVSSSARRVSARENGVTGPQLVVGYTLPPVVPVVVPFDGIQSIAGGVELRFRALAGNIYAVQSRDNLPTEPWLTLTNVVSKFVDLDATVQDPADGPRRFYQLVITGQVD